MVAYAPPQDGEHSSAPSPIFLDLAAAGKILSLSRSSLYRYIDSGELKPVKLRRSLRIPYAQIVAFAERRIAEAQGEK